MNYCVKNCLAFFLFLMTSLVGYGQATRHVMAIQDKGKMSLIGEKTHFLKDEGGKLSLHDILKPQHQKKFQQIKQNVFTHPATEAVFWFKFRLENQTKKDLWLEIGSPFDTWYADFYAPTSSGVYPAPKLLGALRPQENNEYPSNYYCVLLVEKNDSTAKTYYLKVSGKMPHTRILRVGTVQALARHSNVYLYAVAIFVGLLLGMIIYNGFLFYSIKERVYLIYTLMLVMFLVTTPFENGYPLFYGDWLWHNFIVWDNIGFVTGTLFATYYLKLATTARRFYYWLWFLTFLGFGVLGVLNLFNLLSLPVLLELSQVVILIFVFSLLFCGIYLWVKGNQNARLYTLAWLFFIVSIFIFIFMINGFLSVNWFTQNIIYVGVSSEVLIFALALGHQYNMLKQEKEAAQERNMQLIAKQNEVLEQKVKEKTQGLQNANEELVTSNEELLQSQEEIAAQRDQLERNHKLITQSITAAKNIQQATLPSEQYIQTFIQHHFILYKPRDIVSGDFYWVELVKNNLFLIAVDCTGHGVPGAFMSMVANTLLDNIIKVNKVFDPAEILTNLHQEIKQGLNQEQTGNNSGMDVALVKLHDYAKNQVNVEFAGAKRPLIYIPSDTFELQEIKGTRTSIGGSQGNMIAFETHQVALPKGSYLYFGSDGLADQNNKKRKKFGEKRLKQFIQDNHSLALSKQKQLLEQALLKHMEGTKQRDDILWIGVQV
ncbi:7TM diverse intracellular signaling domain-containing protein [uncultured Microscilla sp.]|uniref:7TM diverse intracellular signaling domain-containing protein n=1 Tax=uncultured Microscilla sp. TaxID=432653 RepID=UPI002607964F|nr:7TM diverse intracellular signaling domain-containing protein [uncultured Microscilla sp.]